MSNEEQINLSEKNMKHVVNRLNGLAELLNDAKSIHDTIVTEMKLLQLQLNVPDQIVPNESSESEQYMSKYSKPVNRTSPQKDVRNINWSDFKTQDNFDTTIVIENNNIVSKKPDKVEGDEICGYMMKHYNNTNRNILHSAQYAQQKFYKKYGYTFRINTITWLFNRTPSKSKELSS